MLARYKIRHELGRGATGAVYAARDRTTGADLALKRLDPALLKSDAGIAARFLKQARSARALTHDNIVRIHEAGEAAGTAYVAMERLEGESLRKILDAGPIHVARAIRIAHDVAAGLAHAHLEGMVHGGLKPSNIIVLRSGAAKITDFGIGQLGPAALLAGGRTGSLGYMSPEQLTGGPVDHRCDIFSLGAVLYEMLAQRPPFAGGSPAEIRENILRGAPPRPSELNPLVPRALDGIVLSMLAAQPAERMPGVPILLRELQHLEEGLGLGSEAAPPPPPPPAAEERPRHHEAIDREVLAHQRAIAIMERESRAQHSSGSRPAILASIALVLALIAIGLSAFMYYSSGPGEPGIAATPAPATAAPTAPPAPPAVLPPAAPAPPVVAEAAPAEVPQEKAAEVPAQPEAPAAQPQAPAPQPGATARVIVAVSPRSEIYVNGDYQGMSPPITTLEVEPGMHRIEVRNGSRKPYLTYMTLQAGDVRRIRHDFNAKRIRPPG